MLQDIQNYNQLDVPKVWQLSDSEGEDGQKFVKVPIAYMCEYPHQKYGTVKFDQQDFDDIIGNYEGVRAGYDPALYIGHGTNPNIVDGELAEGWPERIYQDGDTLYGEYSPTNQELFDLITLKKLKYASAEVVRNATDKFTKEPIGTLLKAVCLTNKPSVPFKTLARDTTLQVIERYSDVIESPHDPFLLVFTLQNNESPMITDNSTNPALSSPAAVETPQNLSDIPGDTVSKSKYDDLVGRYTTLASDYTQLSLKVSASDQKLSDFLKSQEDKKRQDDVLKLNNLPLPAETRQFFSDMISQGDLTDENRDKLLSQVQQLSDTYKPFFEVQGNSEEQVKDAAHEYKIPESFLEVGRKAEEIEKARNYSNVVR